MKQYNVEIFDRGINYVANTTVEELNIKEDYLDPEKWNVDLVDIPIEAIEKNYFIRAYNDTDECIGIIESFETKQEGVVRVTISEIPSLFDVDIMIDVNDFNYTYEQYIAKWLNALFVNGDTSMNVPLQISISSSTPTWSIEYDIENEPDDDEPQPPVEVAFINLFDAVILPAFTIHQIGLDYSVDINNKKILVNIGKNTNSTIVIDTELDNVLDKSITIRKSRNETNKVIVYNEENYTQSITYYLHTDGTFNTTNNNRVLPVAYKLLHTKKETETQDDVEVVTKTFEQNAYDKASETFGRNKYTNLIELNVLSDDELIEPKKYKIGQVVQIISNGIVYNSIYSGRKVGNTTTLIFGTIRLELTKQLKGRG